MKQIAQNYRSGELALVDVPAPRCRPGGVLVRSLFSLISPGTEMMKVSEAGMSLLGKARARPDQVRKVLETAAQQGPQAALTKAMNRLDAYTPLGYSLAGVVTEVGDGVTGFRVGDVVACAGNEHAVHAEVTWIPVNLCARVPEHVDPRHAAFTTCGAISMQGLRQGEVALGEVAVVIGLGLIGQLLTQLLVAAGVTVIGGDLSPERTDLAVRCGAEAGFVMDADGVAALRRSVDEVSRGLGADVVFLTAGGQSNQPVELAASVARDRGRVVDIGKCSLDLPWNAYYDKELEVKFSRSYGPGRYDPAYELEGIDYPAGYVRWTEQRNMACFVDLLASGSIDVEPLISAVEPFGDAADVYRRIEHGELTGVGFLFAYDRAPDEGGDVPTGAGPSTTTPTAVARTRPAVAPPVRVAFVGAGNYAKTMLLPHLTGRDDVSLERVVTSTPLSATTAKKKFGFTHASVSAREVWEDDTIDLVVVVTRHSSHTSLVCDALEAGKAVFVEKPLALTETDVARVLEVVERTGNDRLHVGFNRRFAPLLNQLRSEISPAGASTMRYLVNAGPLDSSSWYLDRGEGSRFAGEGGHFIDTLTWWIGEDPTTVSASGDDRGDVEVRLGYRGGAVGTITYATGGHPRFPKETFDALGGGTGARFDNFTSARSWRGRRRRSHRSLTPDKGQRAQIDAVVGAVLSGSPMPISVDSLALTTLATLLVDRALADGGTHRVELPRST